MSKDIKEHKESTMRLDSAITSPPEKPEFKAFAQEWLKVKEAELKLSSLVKYADIIRRYLLPVFGEKSIEDIARDDVRQFCGSLLEHKEKKSACLSPKTVSCILSLLKSIFAYAKREKSLDVADIKDISIKQPQKPMKILSCSEQTMLSNYLFNNASPCYLGILLSLYTGLRIGEICALKWKDINFTEQYIYVCFTMQRIQNNADNGRKTQLVIMPPKSDCSVRKIPIPLSIMPLLARFEQAPDAFILTGRKDKCIEPRCMENHFSKVKQCCGISNVNFHALRHTFATRCVELGFDIKCLSEILGHASVNITLNRYVHPSMELKRKNMDKLCELLKK